MPVERREIIFSTNEVLQAVNSYNRMKPDLLPQGTVQDVQIVEGDEIRLRVTIEMTYDDRRQAVEIEVKAVDTVELLVRGCLENNIPIPRRATKFLRLIEGSLALVIQVASEEAEEVVQRPAAPNLPQRPRLVRS